MKLAIIIAEHGRPAPDVTQYRETWPDASIRVYEKDDLPDVTELDQSHPRYGWRMNDYWKVRKMLDADADVAMCFDGDMRIVDREAARTLPFLAEHFGICLPINPRYTVLRDFSDGADVVGCVDQTMWFGPSVNCSPIALSLCEGLGKLLAQQYCAEMLNAPVRGPIAWWRAMLSTGVSPLILPPQWCVCDRHISVGNEIILHEGHAAVKKFYAGMGHDGRWKHGG